MTASGIVLPGVPESARAAREFAAKALAGFPAADDAVLCVDELVANSVQHSCSGLPGGVIEVRLTVTAGSVLAEVRDGGPLAPPAGVSRDALAVRGRGLVLVGALAVASGSDGAGLRWFWMPLGGEAL
jgi:serine/threonine-protein kinase RsbW